VLLDAKSELKYHALNCMRLTAFERQRITQGIAQVSGDSGRTREACALENTLYYGALPGLEAYRSGLRAAPNREVACEERGLPGFQAQTYRDLGHSAPGASIDGATGIWGTPVPGIEAHDYRDAGHGGTGKWGTNGPAATGIPGTNRPCKSLFLPGFLARNFVSNNSCNNTSTRGADFSVGGRGACRRKG